MNFRRFRLISLLLCFLYSTAFLFLLKNILLKSSYDYHKSKIMNYSYYVCTQIQNESDEHLIEWIEYQLNIIGFKNICIINVGQSLSKFLMDKYPIAYITKTNHIQEFNYCLSCFENPMHVEDILMIQDIDEFLNIQQSDIIFKNYNAYDMFHFDEIRYGYVYKEDKDMINKSLLMTNVYRKPHRKLGEHTRIEIRDLFHCKESCYDGNGKEMIKVGKIQKLGVHYHTSHDNHSQRLFIDMKKIRLNHYSMRTKENSIWSAKKWNKLNLKQKQIDVNDYFKIVYDDTILQSKSLF